MGQPDNNEQFAYWRTARSQSCTSGVADPFVVNPIRRSLGLVVVCLALLVGPWLISEQAGTTVMLSVGWLAATGLVMGLPILVWSCVEELIRILRRRVHPSIDLLELSPRVEHVLARHGFQTIESVDQTPDDGLLLLSNMDARSVREIRRAITLWKYRRWQENGFAATGDD
jgi:hypothetical protein